LISRSSVAEHRLDKAGVGGSFPPAGTSFHLGVAQQAARVFREHEAAGSKPATETNHLRALGCGRSSMAELRVVTPPVPVRLRPVTPKRMRLSGARPPEAAERPLGAASTSELGAPISCVANSSGRVPAS
jgi:hypothetical protein